LPARPEINAVGETRLPTEKEHAKIQNGLQGNDFNAVYEEWCRENCKKFVAAGLTGRVNFHIWTEFIGLIICGTLNEV
jgi:hypothetical protein